MKPIYFSLIYLCTMSVYANSPLPDNRHVSIQGSATVEAKPDLADISFEVEVMKSTTLAAKQELDKRVNALLEGLNTFDIQDEHVSASSLLTEPHIIYDDEDNPIESGYIATRSIIITLTDIDKLNDFLNFALSVKIDTIEDIKFRSSKSSQYRQKATMRAVRNARNKANMYAEAFGAKLGQIYSIDPSAHGSRYQYGIERIEVTGSQIDSAYLSTGRYLQATITFSVSVNAVFDLEVE
ncbi:SIMPL domain-containing protein [Pseudoalteromonas luteoviolacea]|uniref:Oxidative stress defense protein n=1 Tax=Pseudoalteromonas luteoviolacea S4054 TaxID=1129367 RepID=A0A0F6A8B3_9GAMM|nr:SIMPL domain-containing protein [Pseudoalteromonas luteoviolacea]AOT11153.1 hypothetical protein S4054249_25325 [Pseudoalteromonas luteoviolacea]AOT15683.1 hypothetical protein S40542_23185 [Pseudoalteromonas luteoviolacea]AOT20974.1 hypothetical protein S4054_25245 [Pseudoalteromonas luteoviolacea]KKE82457.1 hypothetical protein N479_18460 [Pseudoalteromonas luteoviolacea S4054]KZN67401.1 hypothetical protein N481_02310 [Pseudoalteromonas luteoviolacea S4047-1]